MGIARAACKTHPSGRHPLVLFFRKSPLLFPRRRIADFR
jgi:hypothetical protein